MALISCMQLLPWGYTVLITCCTFEYFSFLNSHIVCFSYRVILYFFFSNGLHPALHLSSFGYIMKRSPVTVGGQSLINHREGKFYMGKGIFHTFAISKIYHLSIKGLCMFISFLSIFLKWPSFRKCRLYSDCNTCYLIFQHFLSFASLSEKCEIGNENSVFFFSL